MIVMTETRLDEMLTEWRREYGPGGLPGKASHVLQVLIDHKGEPPSHGGGAFGRGSRSIADDVEDAVTRMQLTPCLGVSQYYRAAMVLRAEHLTPGHWPEVERLAKLRRIGLDISRHTYYRAMQFGRAYLMQALTTKAVA